MGADDGPFGPVVNGTQIVFFEYRPNKAAGFSFVALFGLATICHFIYFVWFRAWFFIPFLLGGIAEAFGYYGRALASDEPAKAGPFIMQNVLILSATPFLAATVYMSLGRVIVALNAQRYSVISIRWMTKLYVLIDIGCIVSQFVGSILPASGDAQAIKNARIILIAGLITQLVALALFMFTCWHAYQRISRDPPGPLIADPFIKWRRYFLVIGVVVVLMIVRSVVRSSEYLQGDGAFIISHEAFIYVFDASPMFIVMAIFLFVHPGRLVRNMRQTKGFSEGHITIESQDG